MKEHAENTRAVWIKCNFCNEGFDTIYRKRQHQCGAHGQGWTAPCGQKCAWPGKLIKHKRYCGQCIDIWDKEKTQKSKLVKRIARKAPK